MVVRHMPVRPPRPSIGGVPASFALFACNHWRSMVICGYVIVPSWVLMFGEYTHVHDADSVLPAIMSVEKLTWYYWGQDRFRNLLPFLLCIPSFSTESVA